MSYNLKISPSLLSADLARLDDEVRKLCEAGADSLHLDMMDGRFVPNTTFDEEFVKKVKAVSTIPLDVHLMIEDVELHAEKYVKAGADILTVHVESTGFSVKLLHRIRSFGKVKVGISIKPATPASALKDVIKDVDLILVMTVEPGFGGQKFLSSQLHKIKEIRAMVGKKIDVAVDGGINPETAKFCVEAGANVLVSGSYIFGGSPADYKARIAELRRSIKQ